LAAQLGIYIGFVHYRLLGATLVGLAFVLPSFIMVVLLGMAYKLYSGLPWMQAVFYGVGAAVIGIISMSVYKLTIKSIGKLNANAIKANWLLWLFYFVGILVTVLTQREEVLLFIFTGLIYMLVKAPPHWIRKPVTSQSIILAGIGFWEYSNDALLKIGLFFAKAGAFVFGSGLAIVPFLHAGVVQQYQWLTEAQFVDSVAVAMITPGPVVITVGFIGYLVGGFPGASIAALATFLPCFLFTVILAPSFKKIAKNHSIKAFVDGITASVIGALAGSVIIIGTRSIVDITTAIIAVITVFALIYIRKLQEPHIIVVAAVAGLLIKSFL
jgi:chromate transporter